MSRLTSVKYVLLYPLSGATREPYHMHFFLRHQRVWGSSFFASRSWLRPSFHLANQARHKMTSSNEMTQKLLLEKNEADRAVATKKEEDESLKRNMESLQRKEEEETAIKKLEQELQPPKTRLEGEHDSILSPEATMSEAEADEPAVTSSIPVARRLWTKEEDKELIRLCNKYRHKKNGPGAKRGTMNWEEVVKEFHELFGKGRSKHSLQSRVRRELSDQILTGEQAIKRIEAEAAAKVRVIIKKEDEED